jgi:F-type H+-transporting ATPase subunit b
MVEEHASGLVEILASTAVWYGVAVVIFFVVLFVVARKPILAWLDGEIEKIRNELEQAKKLRAEAANLLADYQVSQKEALKEAEEIVRQAKAEAVQLRAAAEKELKESLQKHEQKAIQRIHQAEMDAVEEVRTAVIDQAVAVALDKLKAGINAEAAEKIIDQAINEIPKLADIYKVA